MEDAHMTSQTTFYFSQFAGKLFYDPTGETLGRINDFLIDVRAWSSESHEPQRPRVLAISMKQGKEHKTCEFLNFEIRKYKGKQQLICRELKEHNTENLQNCIWLKENILDKQIVDLEGRKLVRVNDVRMVMIPSGTYALAVDVGIEGLLRRLGVLTPISRFVESFGLSLPDKMILWDDIEAVDFSNSSIKLSKASSKLNTLHPSDLADIIEDLDKASRAYVFSTLDEEKAADVLEELEPEVQAHIVESLPVEMVADVLELMPADEVADLIDELGVKKAEEILNEMEDESSKEVRELLEYPDKVVGSIMTTDYMTFTPELTVEETFRALRKEKPEPSYIYSIFVVDKKDKLISSIPLGELVISDPLLTLGQIMKPDPIMVYDDDDLDTLAEIVSKYNLLAVPVINRSQELEGVVVIEDIVEDLLDKRKTK
ncbi:MAG: CBS domain-containing protein [Bacteroidetes bacterium]|nr:CBS domain-containing protein [Bacteroidota bacterium]